MKFYTLVFGNRFSILQKFQDPGTSRSLLSKIGPSVLKSMLQRTLERLRQSCVINAAKKLLFNILTALRSSSRCRTPRGSAPAPGVGTPAKRPRSTWASGRSWRCPWRSCTCARCRSRWRVSPTPPWSVSCRRGSRSWTSPRDRRSSGGEPAGNSYRNELLF